MPAVFDGDLASLAEFLERPQRGQPDQEVVIARRFASGSGRHGELSRI